MERVAPNRFGQIDFCLCTTPCQQCVYDCFSTREYSLASHHSPVVVSLFLEVVKTKSSKSTRTDYKSLRDTSVAREFAEAVEHDFPHGLCRQSSHNVTHTYEHITSCMETVSKVILPSVVFVPKRPWD